jgi:hypothetical protein
MVAAGAAWVRAARPDLRADQVTQVLRLSARDLETPGYDPHTGYGLVTVGAALTREAPPRDPLEPNDDVVWVDGRAFGRADTPIWRGSGTRRLAGSLDRHEDPNDVYRVRVGGRRAARVTLRVSTGDADVALYSPRARGTSDRRARLRVSRRRGAATDAITIRNASRRARTYFVHAHVSAAADRLDARYTLTVRRARYR